MRQRTGRSPRCSTSSPGGLGRFRYRSVVFGVADAVTADLLLCRLLLGQHPIPAADSKFCDEPQRTCLVDDALAIELDLLEEQHMRVRPRR